MTDRRTRFAALRSADLRPRGAMAGGLGMTMTTMTMLLGAGMD